METAALIITLATGFALGLYLSTQLTDWIDKNSKKQHMKQAMNWIYIAMTISAIGFIVYANYWSSNQHKKKVDTTEKPISQPADEWNHYMDSILTNRLDAVMDSMNMDCGEYHGKEGQSEYGEYEYNKWMDMQ